MYEFLLHQVIKLVIWFVLFLVKQERWLVIAQAPKMSFIFLAFLKKKIYKFIPHSLPPDKSMLHRPHLHFVPDWLVFNNETHHLPVPFNHMIHLRLLKKKSHITHFFDIL